MTNVRKITAQQFKKLANGRRKVMGDNKVVHCPKSIALEGAPGMGKTAVIRSLGEDWKLPVVTVAINQWCNAADIVGFNYVGHKAENGVFEIAGEDAVPPWMPVYRIDPVTGDRVKTSDETKGYKVWRDPKTNMTEAHPAIILLDEFSAANQQIQGAFLSVALDKVVKNFKLDNDTNFFIAYNSCERAGFEGQNSEISDALVSCNGRFDPMELVYDWYPVNEAVKKNKDISAFWKAFSTKYLKDLDICNDNVRGDKNSCGRTWESTLVELSNNCFDSKNWNDEAELILDINFATSPEVVKKFISYVKTFDIPTGEDFLSGKVVVKKYSDAVMGINAMVSLFGFRNRANETIISNKELSFFENFLNTEYETGTKNPDGSAIFGSKTELYMVAKSALLRENLESRKEFGFIASVLNSYEQKNSDAEEF